MAMTYRHYEAAWHDVDNGGRLEVTLYDDGRLRALRHETSADNDDDQGIYAPLLHVHTRVRHRPRKRDFEIYTRRSSIYPGRPPRVDRVYAQTLSLQEVGDALALLAAAGLTPFEVTEVEAFGRFAQSVGCDPVALAQEVKRHQAILSSNRDLQVYATGESPLNA